MTKITSSPNEDLTISLKLLPLLGRRQSDCTKMIPSHDFILSNIQCKSQQIILEGIEYE